MKDVFLDVPNLSVGSINLHVGKLEAQVSLSAKVGTLLVLDAGVSANIEKVNLTITGVQAQLTMEGTNHLEEGSYIFQLVLELWSILLTGLSTHWTRTQISSRYWLIPSSLTVSGHFASRGRTLIECLECNLWNCDSNSCLWRWKHSQSIIGLCHWTNIDSNQWRKQ